MKVMVFLSESCPSCRAQQKSLDRAIEEAGPHLEVVRVSVEEDDWESAREWDIWGVPALVVIGEGEEVLYKHVGPLTLKQLREVL